MVHCVSIHRRYYRNLEVRNDCGYLMLIYPSQRAFAAANIVADIVTIRQVGAAHREYAAIPGYYDQAERIILGQSAAHFTQTVCHCRVNPVVQSRVVQSRVVQCNGGNGAVPLIIYVPVSNCVPLALYLMTT